MTYAAQYNDFIKDKRSFFSTPHTTQEIFESVSQKDHKFLSVNKALIEQEFNLLFASLKKQAEVQDKFWFYCYYCCTMLRAYNQNYANYAKVEEYERLMRQIKLRCEQDVVAKKRRLYKESFIEMLANKLASDLADMADAFLHVTKMRSRVGLYNVYRIYWTFCRLTLTSAFALARDSHLIDELNRLLGTQVDADKIIKTLEAPNNILRAFSVGFFAARFIMNAGMLLKHTLAPSKNESSKSMLERFSSELWKRHPDFLNDLVWGSVNGLSNYAEVFHISAPVAGWLTAGFLVFDVCLLLYRRKLLQDEFWLKQAQLRDELRYWQDLLDKDPTTADAHAHCKLILDQLTELEITWTGTSATYFFNVAAAGLLATGFTLSMLLTGGFVVASYAICMVGVAMYLSADAFGRYREASLRLGQAEIDNVDTKAILADYEKVRDDFIYTMVKQIIFPGLLVATLAICWEAALVMTAVYMLYELWRSYQKHSDSSPGPLPVFRPEDEEPLYNADLIPVM